MLPQKTLKWRMGPELNSESHGTTAELPPQLRDWRWQSLPAAGDFKLDDKPRLQSTLGTWRTMDKCVSMWQERGNRNYIFWLPPCAKKNILNAHENPLLPPISLSFSTETNEAERGIVVNNLSIRFIINMKLRSLHLLK